MTSPRSMSASKPPPVCDAGSAAPIEGGTPGDSPSATLAVALVTSERRAEQVLRVCAQLVARARLRNARARDLGAVPRRERHLPPADAVRKRVVLEAEHGPCRGRLVDGVEPKRLEPAGAVTRGELVVEHAERNALSVEREFELAGEPRRVAGSAYVVPELEGGNLGQVEDVVDEDPVARRPRCPRTG